MTPQHRNRQQKKPAPKAPRKANTINNVSILSSIKEKAAPDLPMPPMLLVVLCAVTVGILWVNHCI